MYAQLEGTVIKWRACKFNVEGKHSLHLGLEASLLKQCTHVCVHV